MVEASVNQISPFELVPLEQNHSLNIGSGTFGECILKRYKRFGIVVLEKQLVQSDIKAVISEAQCMNILTHKSIPHLLGVQIEHKPYSLVMEFIGDNMESITVHKLLFQSKAKQSPLSTNEWILVCTDITEAVEHIHNKGFLHCDLKTNNVLVSQKRGYVIDFGKACPTSRPSAKKYTSFYQHIAPEVLRGQSVSTASDVFSLGVIIYTVGKTLQNTHVKSLGKQCKDTKPFVRLCF